MVMKTFVDCAFVPNHVACWLAASQHGRSHVLYGQSTISLTQNIFIYMLKDDSSAEHSNNKLALCGVLLNNQTPHFGRRKVVLWDYRIKGI